MALRQTTNHIRLADGRTLACDPTGSPVFYPGSRLEGRSAADTARRLGLRLIAPDRPGFGESTFQPGRTIGAWATDVAELADQIALGRFAIVGVSGGAPCALACAARIPDRVRRVALSGAWDRSRTSNSLAIWSPARMAASLAAPAPFIAALTLSGVKGTERSRTPTASNTALEIGPGQARSALGSLPSSRASPTSRPRSRRSLPRAYGSPML